MKLNKKIPAFTLAEMIVVLILTSIVAGLAFTVLTLIQKQMLGIQENFKHNSELNLLEQSLLLDFNRYNSVNFDEIENQLKFSTELDSVFYGFKPDYIVKQQDTFHIQIKEKLLFFNGKQVENGKVDAIKMETTKRFLNQKLFVFKPNDANQFMD